MGRESRAGEGRGLLLRGGEERGREGRISPYQSTFASGAHAHLRHIHIKVIVGCYWSIVYKF